MPSDAELADRFREIRSSLDAIPEVKEPPKTTLRILGNARIERKWNTLLAYFLDPFQPHGFDADLLKRFLDTATDTTLMDLDYIHREIEDVEVDMEVSTPEDNRYDVVIRSRGNWFVCVESKVEASEGRQQTHRYLEDPHLGSEEKESYPEDGRHYLFLSKASTRGPSADGFGDLNWREVVEAFENELRSSHGRYPQRSVSQLDDFISTVKQVTRMEEDDFTQTQKEKVKILAEYRDDIDEVVEAADKLRQRSIEEWPEPFFEQLDEELWGDDWYARRFKPEYGVIYRRGWYMTPDEHEVIVDEESIKERGGFRIHYNHMIRNEESFTEGELTFRLNSFRSIDFRDEFHRLYNSDRWQQQLEPLLDERNITNKGNKKLYTIKTYDVDQARLPESYFETLATAFEEHLPVSDIVSEIVEEVRENVVD